MATIQVAQADGANLIDKLKHNDGLTSKELGLLVSLVRAKMNESGVLDIDEIKKWIGDFSPTITNVILAISRVSEDNLWENIGERSIDSSWFEFGVPMIADGKRLVKPLVGFSPVTAIKLKTTVITYHKDTSYRVGIILKMTSDYILPNSCDDIAVAQFTFTWRNGENVLDCMDMMVKDTFENSNAGLTLALLAIEISKAFNATEFFMTTEGNGVKEIARALGMSFTSDNRNTPVRFHKQLTEDGDDEA